MSAIIQAHFLTSYAASLLNRDDAGFAKRINFGGHQRIRVSSQCLKRAWRESIMAMADAELPTAVRSCSVFEQQVLPAVVAQGIDEERARQGLRALLERCIKGSTDDKDKLSLVTKQPVLMGHREVQLVTTKMGELLRADGKPADLVATMLKTDFPAKTFAHLLGVQDSLAYGVETALFGRFVTSDVLSRTDSSVSVANAMTVHSATPELDFFSVVDDLNGQGGADHVGESELSAGLFYLYVNLDLAELTANITGCNKADWKSQDLTVTKKLAALLLKLVATKSPGAKQGSTAPYARSEFVLLESGVAQPRQLANAFRKPVRAGDADLMEVAANAIAQHLAAQDGMYGVDTKRVVSSIAAVEVPAAEAIVSLDEAIARAVDSAIALG